MIYLNGFTIERFRGIKDLKVKGLGDVNLVVGDNNSGKTSVLEAIMLLKNMDEFSNVVNVSRLRDNRITSMYGPRTFDKFIYMFDPQREAMIKTCHVPISADKTLSINERKIIEYLEANKI